MSTRIIGWGGLLVVAGCDEWMDLDEDRTPPDALRLSDTAAPPDCTWWFLDADGDGYGDPTEATAGHSAPPGHVPDGTDCDDGDAAVHPGATERFGNSIDEDCDGHLRPTAACDGVAVPGDYATIQAAVDAMVAAVTPMRQICLGEGTYEEDLTVYLKGHQTIGLAGVDADASLLRGDLFLWGPGTETSAFELRNLSIDGGIDTFNPRLLVQDVVITGGGPNGPGIYGSSRERIEVVRSDISVAGDAIQVNGGSLTVRDSYIHDSGVGVHAVSMGRTVVVVLSHVTFADNGVGILGENGWPHSSATVFRMTDNVVVGSVTGIALDQPAPIDVNTALFDNVTNYAGVAGPGTGTLTVDPLLDWSVIPPAPGAGSPLIDGGSEGGLDFWLQPRTAPDIGAVEFVGG